MTQSAREQTLQQWIVRAALAALALAPAAALADVGVTVGADADFYAGERVYDGVPAFSVGGGVSAHASAGFSQPPPPAPPGQQGYYPPVPPPQPPPEPGPVYGPPPQPAPEPAPVYGPPPVYGPSHCCNQAPPPQAGVAARAPQQPILAIGAFLGGGEVEETYGNSSAGLLARLRLTRNVALEGELSAEVPDEVESDSSDHRAGGALLFSFLNHGRLSAYILGGAGVVYKDVMDGQARERSPYAELGLGLELELSRSFSLAIDGRAGGRRLEDDPALQRAQTAGQEPDRAESYTRGRLAALIYF